MENDLLAWITEQLNARDWSQRKLAREAGLSHSHVANVISGNRGVTFDFCAAVAQALGEPPDKLFRMAGLLPSLPESAALEAELLHHFRLLDEEQRRTALALLKALKGR